MSLDLTGKQKTKAAKKHARIDTSVELVIQVHVGPSKIKRDLLVNTDTAPDHVIRMALEQLTTEELAELSKIDIDVAAESKNRPAWLDKKPHGRYTFSKDLE
jgi:hypothetical protein